MSEEARPRGHDGRGGRTVVEQGRVDADLAVLWELDAPLKRVSIAARGKQKESTHIEDPLVPVLDALLADLLQRPVRIKLLARLDIVPRVGEEVRLVRGDDCDAG